MWITITESDLLEVISGQEMDMYRDGARQLQLEDPIPVTIAQITALVRGYVGAWGQNRLGERGTIPERLLKPALDLIALRLPQRVRVIPNDKRKQKALEALRLLETVADGKFDIEEPVIENESAE